MPIDFSTDVYLPAYEQFARIVTITPTVSQPGAPPYAARGIFDDNAEQVGLLDSGLFSDAQIILDIREREFPVLPLQGDQVDIPADSGIEAEGGFEVIDTQRNGGGETTLTLRKLVPAKP